MPPGLNNIKIALDALEQFRKHAISSHHERFIFPFLCGSYFAYRKIDVERIVAIAQTVAKNNPTYLDVGCGYGDFLQKIRQYLPNAEGMEKSVDIFFKLKRFKPDYIKIGDAYNGIERKYDVIFVGWMEPGVDYRSKIAEKTDVIVTTLDQGLSLAAEFDGYGFEKIASWITPSWEDVNTEITNNYYSKMTEDMVKTLHNLRGAHNLWYVYSKPKYVERIKEVLRNRITSENKERTNVYGFEKTLDESGFRYLENINSGNKNYLLWNIVFDT